MLFLGFAMHVNAQTNSCETAFPLVFSCSQNAQSFITLSSTDSPNVTMPLACPLVDEFQSLPTREYWMKFTAIHPDMYVTLYISGSNQFGLSAPMLEVYSGNCAALEYDTCWYYQGNGSVNIVTRGLTVGQDYYLRILDNNYVDPTDPFGWQLYYNVALCANCSDVNGASVSSTSTQSCDGSAIPLSATALDGVTYQWQLNGENIAGAATNQISATLTGNYSLIVSPNDSVACSSYTTNLSNIHIGTPANISTAGQPALCNGQSTELTAPLASGNTYQWGNPSAISGAIASNYTVSTPGTYTLTLNDGICPASTDEITIGTGTQPTAPLITPQGSLVLCDGSTVLLSAQATAGITYQWTLDGTVISNAITANFTADATGIYCLIAANASGCRDTSNCLPVTNCVGFETLASSDIALYPNPVSQALTIEIPSNHRIESMALLDIQGRVIYVQAYNSPNGKYQVPVSEISNGIYFISIYTTQGKITKRFVKTE